MVLNQGSIGTAQTGYNVVAGGCKCDCCCSAPNVCPRCNKCKNCGKYKTYQWYQYPNTIYPQYPYTVYC